MSLTRTASRLLPGGARRRAANAWRAWTGVAVRHELARIARSDRPVIVGPWMGEVGFELLYWLPFLQWAVREFEIDPARLLVVSRGGTASWYRRMAPRYRDVFELLSPEEFRVHNGTRASEVGEQKQVRVTALESDIAARLAREEGLDRPLILHPGLMYRVFNPFWWGYADASWVRRHAHFERLPAIRPGERPLGLPESYSAVKFYYNDAFPATVDNRACADRVVRELADEGPVVSLATGLRLDDHPAWEEEERRARSIGGTSAATNLATQNAIVAGAREWVGTYGGFAYLAPFHGVRARAWYSRADGFSRRHLDLALSVFEEQGSQLLTLSDVHDVRPLAVAR